MTIKVVLDKKARIFIRGLRDRVKTDVPKQAQDMGRILQRNIEKQIDAFAKNPTGALARSFDIRIRRSAGGSFSVRMQSDKPYALIHETGGPIRAKNHFPLGQAAGAFLHFESPTHGWVLKRQVFIRPKRYLTKALNKALPEIQKLTTRTLATIVRTSAARAR